MILDVQLGMTIRQNKLELCGVKSKYCLFQIWHDLTSFAESHLCVFLGYIELFFVVYLFLVHFHLKYISTFAVCLLLLIMFYLIIMWFSMFLIVYYNILITLFLRRVCWWLFHSFVQNSCWLNLQVFDSQCRCYTVLP